MPDQREIFACEVGLFVRELAREAICLHAYENMHVLLCFALTFEGMCGSLADTVRTLPSHPFSLDFLTSQ